MTYYKYRESFSSGYSQWQYVAIPNSIKHKDVGEYLNDCSYLHNGGEHWRGVEWKKVNILPREEIESEIENSRSIINERKERIKMLKGMLKFYPKIKAKVILTSWEKFEPKNILRWVTITNGKKQLYISKKGFYSSEAKLLARTWCDKNGYKIAETKYEKVICK